MRPVALFAVSLVSAWSAAAAESAEGPKTVAVIGAFGESASSERAALLAQLHTAVEGVEGFALLEPDRTAQEVEGAEALGLECDADDDGCLGRLAVTLPADLLVVPVLRAAGPATTLRLAAFDSVTAGKLNQVEDELAPLGPRRLGQIKGMVELLLAPERALGALVVRVDRDAVVSVDGYEPRSGSDVRVDGIVPGSRWVTVTAGELRWERTVDLSPGEVKEIEVSLGAPEPSPAADGGSSLLTIAGGSAVAAGALGLVAGGLLVTGGAAAFYLLDAPGPRVAGLGAAATGGGLAVIGLVAAAGGAAGLGAGILLE